MIKTHRKRKELKLKTLESSDFDVRTEIEAVSSAYETAILA